MKKSAIYIIYEWLWHEVDSGVDYCPSASGQCMDTNMDHVWTIFQQHSISLGLLQLVCWCASYMHMTKHGIQSVSSTWHVTKHRDRCLSLTGTNWVSAGVGIDFLEWGMFQKCSPLKQCQEGSYNRLLRMKWNDLMRTKCFETIRQATVGNKTVWMFESFGLCIEYIF